MSNPPKSSSECIRMSTNPRLRGIYIQRYLRLSFDKDSPQIIFLSCVAYVICIPYYLSNMEQGNGKLYTQFVCPLTNAILVSADLNRAI